ncbi:MAG: energy transducer TonB [Opitutus sp.]
MKAALLLCLSIALNPLVVRATDATTPVVNAVRFTGDYVTFKEAKPKFRPVHQEQPVYPQDLLSKRVEGYALVAFLVDLDGATTQVQVVEATDTAFGDAARNAIAQWQFSPPQFGGTPGRIAMTLPVEFTVPSHVAMETTASKPQAGS